MATPQRDRKAWSETELLILRENYPYKLMSELRDLLARRSDRAIYMQAKVSGLKKTPETLLRANKDRPVPEGFKASQFKPGIVPHNAGRPLKEWMTEAGRKRSAKTQFKGRPATAYPPGHIFQRQRRQDKVPYLYISAEKGKPKEYHRHVWEKANGPIPDAHIVVFIDGNTLNCELANLMLLSRAENMERNSIHRYPGELKSLIKLNAKLKKKLHEKQD